MQEAWSMARGWAINEYYIFFKLIISIIMGNNQSSPAQKECPSSSFCKALCFGSPPSDGDDGEWFGNLPKDKKNKKRRKSQKRVKPSRLPSVPEEATTCSTVETEGSSSKPLSSSFLSTNSIDEGDEVGSLRTHLERRATEGQLLKPTSRVLELPKTKLTFVDGQFVDMSKFPEMCSKDESVDESLPGVGVRGFEVSV